MDFRGEFEGKKITVMGLGLLGRAVGDTAFLAECGAELIVTDLKTTEQLKDSLAQLVQFKNIRFVLGEHRFEDFENRDFILKAAGVPLESPYIAHAEKNNVPVRMSAAIFMKLAQIPVVGVTGTRGKSTVTHLMHHVLKESVEGTNGLGLNNLHEQTVGPRATESLGLARTISRSEIVLGGNVRGVSNLQLLKDVTEESVGVFELDSWQLQGFGREKVSPQIAIFTSFMPDHLNYYGGDIEKYFEDKAQIFLHQQAGDLLVTTPAVFALIQSYATKCGLTLPQEVILADDSSLPEEISFVMPGKHNRLNAGLAYETLRAMSLSPELIQEGFATFRGVPGRLELLREHRGVKIYNDNNATTPEATLAGLRAVSLDRNVILIVGGADKSLDVSVLAREIPKYTRQVITIPGTGTDRLLEILKDAQQSSTVTDAVTKAVAVAENGDVILFSPGFASFGAFQNEYDRNDQFVKLVEGL